MKPRAKKVLKAERTWDLEETKGKVRGNPCGRRGTTPTVETVD